MGNFASFDRRVQRRRLPTLELKKNRGEGTLRKAGSVRVGGKKSFRQLLLQSPKRGGADGKGKIHGTDYGKEEEKGQRERICRW